MASAMDVSAEPANDEASSELTVYGAVGVVFVFLLLALVLALAFHGSLCHSQDKHPHRQHHRQQQRLVDDEREHDNGAALNASVDRDRQVNFVPFFVGCSKGNITR